MGALVLRQLPTNAPYGCATCPSAGLTRFLVTRRHRRVVCRCRQQAYHAPSFRSGSSLAAVSAMRTHSLRGSTTTLPVFYNHLAAIHLKQRTLQDMLPVASRRSRNGYSATPSDLLDGWRGWAVLYGNFSAPPFFSTMVYRKETHRFLAIQRWFVLQVDDIRHSSHP